MNKYRGLAGMDSVAGTNKSNDNFSTNISSKNNNDNNINIDYQNEIDNKIETDSIEDIINEIANKEKTNTKRQIAFYLDEDVAKAFDRYAKKNGKGAKSELIQKLLQSTLRKAGYLK